MTAPTVSQIVNQLKGAVTKAVGCSVWQKSFYDHIIRNKDDYVKFGIISTIIHRNGLWTNIIANGSIFMRI